jgi:hypothetical protein
VADAMSFYNTGNPVPSIDPRDLDDNAKHIDEIVNSTFPTFVDRSGTERQTLAGIEANNSNLAGQLADDTDPAKGAALVGYSGRTVAESLENFLHAADCGVVGDFVTDDTAAFTAACAKAVALKKPLHLGCMKLLLSTQAASINTDGLVLIGDKTVVYTPPAVFDILLGTVGMASVLADAANAQMAVIFSSFNGPVFSGKRLDFKNICIICDYANVNSSAFVQSTPTTYPGWSNCLDAADNVGAYYTGSHGIELKGGWEIGVARGIRTGYNGGIGLYIHETAGVNSPIEYITFDDACAFFWGLLGNVVIDGVRKHIHFGKVLLNNAGQVRLAVARNPSFTIDSEDDITYAIRLVLDGQASIETITLDGIYGEEVQGLLKTTGNFSNNVILKSSYIIPMSDGIVPGSSAWLWRNASFEHSNSSHMKLENNASLAGSAQIRFANHSSSSSILIDLKETILGTLAFSQRRGYLYYDETSGTVGDGTANTFTSAIAQIFPATGANEGARHAVYLVTANFQGSGSTNGGGYLMAVTRQNSGNYFAIIWAGGSVTGFTGAPSISTAGVISLPLAANYRARITRLDHTALTF